MQQKGKRKSDGAKATPGGKSSLAPADFCGVEEELDEVDEDDELGYLRGLVLDLSYRYLPVLDWSHIFGYHSGLHYEDLTYLWSLSGLYVSNKCEIHVRVYVLEDIFVFDTLISRDWIVGHWSMASLWGAVSNNGLCVVVVTRVASSAFRIPSWESAWDEGGIASCPWGGESFILELERVA